MSAGEQHEHLDLAGGEPAGPRATRPFVRVENAVIPWDHWSIRPPPRLSQQELSRFAGQSFVASLEKVLAREETAASFVTYGLPGYTG